MSGFGADKRINEARVELDRAEDRLKAARVNPATDLEKLEELERQVDECIDNLKGLGAEKVARREVRELVDNPASLAEGLLDYVQGFVIFQSFAQAVVIVLWVMHTWAFEAADTTPYMIVTSPQKRSGKTRLQEVVEGLVRNPIRTADASVAFIVRRIERVGTVTLLYDEADTVKGSGERSEALRGMLNAGYRKGASYGRVGGDRNDEDREYPSFTPKMVAAIGELWDTVTDRGPTIRLQRKLSNETVKRFRFRKVEAETKPLRAALEAWAEQAVPVLREMEPELPEKLNDRAQDGFEPLIAIADSLGGEWPQRARAAAVELSGGELVSDENASLLLLEHLLDVFRGSKPAPDFENEKLWSATILEELVEREDGPWASRWVNAVKFGNHQGPASELADHLKPFGIGPRDVKIRDTGGKDHTRKGYYLSDLKPVWQRYLEAKPATPDDKALPRYRAGQDGFSDPEGGPSESQKRASDQGGSVVAPTGQGELGLATSSGYLFGQVEGDCVVCGNRCLAQDSQGRIRHPACPPPPEEAAS